MAGITLTPPTLDALQAHVATGRPSFYFASRTSTVIPYERLARALGQGVCLVDLSGLPPYLALEGEHLICRGAVNWQMAREFCWTQGREVMTFPTEELASILAGVATSCTGERCFGYGSLRSQVVSLEVMGREGQLEQFSADRSLLGGQLFAGKQARSCLRGYQESYRKYEGFKNAPFPRLQSETDLMIGLEGQLGIVVEARLQTVAREPLRYIFLTLPPWEEDYGPHLEVLQRVQEWRGVVHSCELIDANSARYLDSRGPLFEGCDTIFLEVFARDFERVWEELIVVLELLDQSQVYEMPGSKFHQLRMAVPRTLFEVNARNKVIKKGTDVQVRTQQMGQLLELYRQLARQGVDYNLFGHFGDSHLHFNFLPTSQQEEDCDRHLSFFYQQVLLLQGSPFAEHGVGLLKQAFIRPFLGDIHYAMFRYLKAQKDPENIFFPQGYLNLC